MLTKDVKFPDKEGLLHFIAENELLQFAVVCTNEGYELAYIADYPDQPSLA